MVDNNFKRVIIINFITALIITFVACYFLKKINLMDVMHIANLFGLYFLVIYGIDILVESGKIRNSQRFLLAIGLIIVFDLVFLILVPLIFGNVFDVTDYLILVFNGARVDINFNVFIYLAIFAGLMLIFNFLLYLKDRKYEVE